MAQNLVSVILTCYNGEKWIGETIRSVFSQTYKDIEIIIINDGSTDKSSEIIKQFLSDKRVKHIEQKNKGIPGARNRGFYESKGKYICILDQDDIWLPGKVEKQVKYLESNNQIGVVYTGTAYIDMNGKSLGIREFPELKEGNLFELFLDRGVAVPIVGTMIRREVINQAGEFDEKLFGEDDFDILLRISEKTNFGFIPETLTLKRFSPGSTGHSEQMCVDSFYLAEKYEKIWPQWKRKINDYRIRAHYFYGSYLLNLKRLKEARKQFSSVLKLSPFSPRALVKFILTFFMK